MNVLSLFDGMSCGQIALNRAGIAYDKYYASEIDKHAIAVSQHNYPNTKQLGDVTRITTVNSPKIDLLIGGSPCQGFSFAGKQLNFDDPRSKLFFEYVRLKNELKPKWFLLENVVMKKEYAGKISELLGVQPIRINSSLVSGQSRDRLYWTNIEFDLPENVGKNLNEYLEPGWYSTREKSYCIDANYGKGSNLRRYLFCGSRQLVFKDGFTIPEWINKENANEFGTDNKGQWRLLTPEECELLQTVPVGYTSIAPKLWRYHMLGNGWTVDVIVSILKGLHRSLKSV